MDTPRGVGFYKSFVIVCDNVYIGSHYRLHINKGFRLMLTWRHHPSFVGIMGGKKAPPPLQRTLPPVPAGLIADRTPEISRHRAHLAHLEGMPR